MIRRRYFILTGVAAPLALATAAYSFWTGSAVATAQAVTGSMNPPTSVAAATTPGTGSAHVSWTASVPFAGHPVSGYYVQRVRISDNAAAAACGTSPASLTTSASCDDLSVADGTYKYVVTAAYYSWTAAAAPSNTVTVINDSTPPGVTINQAVGQADPANTAPVTFAVAFSEPVTGFDGTDVTLSGTAGATTAAVTGSGASYSVAVTGMTQSGTVIASVGAGRAADLAGNLSLASTSSDNTVSYDSVAPAVTVNQKASQADPTPNLPILYTVTFSEPVTGFDATDLTRGGTSTGGTVAVTGSGAAYEISVSGTPTGGTTQFSVAAGKAADLAGNLSLASTSIDNTVTYDYSGPTNTLSLNTPTNGAFLSGSSLYFASDSAGDFKLLNSVTDLQSAPASTSYPSLTATGWTPAHASETVTTPAGGPFLSKAFAWNANAAVPGDYTVTGSNSTGRGTATVVHFVRDATAPTGNISYPNGYVTALSVPVTITAATDAGSGVNADLTGIKRAEADLGGDGSCGTFSLFSAITLDGGADTDVANGTCYQYEYEIWDNVDHFVTIAPASIAKVNTEVLTGGSISYLDGYVTSASIPVAVNNGSGAASGQVQRASATLSAGNCGTFGTFANVTLTGGNDTGVATGNCYKYQLVVTDAFGKTATYTSTNVVKVDTVKPTVTINQATGQADPTNTPSVTYTAVFSEAVTGFDGTDVTLSGTALATTATVTGSGTTYTVTVTGLAKTGTTVAAVAANTVTDLAGNPNTASTSGDSTVQYNDNVKPSVTINQATGQTDPSNGSTVNFTAVFTEPVTGFDGTKVTIAGTAPGTKTATVTGTGPAYNVAVTGMTNSGTVTVTIAAGKAADLSGNTSNASTSTDNSVTYVDNTAPSVTIDQASGQADPANSTTVNFTAVFSETVTGFTNADVTVGGTATGSKTVTVTGTGPTYNVAVSGITGTGGTVTATIGAGKTQDAAGNFNTAATSTDNTVTFDSVKPSVTVNQAAGQADPAHGGALNFTVVFSEAVTGFSGSDVTLGGTAPGGTATVTGSGTTYNVAVSGMTDNGTVIPSLAVGKVSDLAGNTNTASTSTDSTVTFAAPKLTGVTSGGGTAGLMQTGDTMVFTFSESMDPSSIPTGNTVTVTESRASGFNGTLAIPGLIVANAGIDRRHLGGTNSSGTATGTLVWSNSNKTLTLTLGTVTTTGSGLGTDGTIESIDPAPGLTDLAGNPILATSSASTRLF